MTDSMGIRELSDRTEVSPHTLRYYERAGLMIDVPRDGRGRRAYGDEHVRWVVFLRRLRDAGMGISQIREYAELIRNDGPTARARRLEILRVHRDEVGDRLARLSEHLRILNQKVADGCAPDGT